MTAAHEGHVGARFDALEGRFKVEVAPDDARLRAIRGALGPLNGRRVLDLGCGKGRFAARLRAEGARVVGLDLSAAMLASARGLERVRGTGRRLPFAAGAFDGVFAVEVFEHMEPGGIEATLDEVGRVLRPGGTVAIVDKNAAALDARRPWLPSLALKWIDQRRGRWMYPADGPVRERWFWPGMLRDALRERFGRVQVEFLLSPAEARSRLHRRVPSIRLMALWSARAPGGVRA
jgi:2-polyprenyl-6-hydroxyphenyl methylase/3-demethylubiquinone-9 3-methyltransferase